MTVIQRLSDVKEVDGALQRAKDEAERQISLMRGIAVDVIGDDRNVVVGVNGSVARREVTSGSDVDLFFLVRNGDFERAKDTQSAFRDKLREAGIKMPAHDGVFENPLLVEELLQKIGGEADTNEFTTRRMLFLLEGEWLHNPDGFRKVRIDLISNYVDNEIDDRKLCRYLLNDIIRYWRTICVDFEQKTADGTKPRAIRLIKLRFARMMLYFGGVAAICKTMDMPAAEKRETLRQVFAIPPIDRLKDVFGVTETRPVLAAYATFLNSLNDANIRGQLSLAGRSGMDTNEYSELVEVAREFRSALETLLVGPDSRHRDIASALLL
jgi:predicted nucleotidyltransferase